MNWNEIREELQSKTILAIDPWTIKGWFAIYNKWRILTEQFTVSNLINKYWFNDWKQRTKRDLRLFVIWQSVEDLIVEYDIDQIVVEIPVKYRVTISTFYEIIWVVRSISSKYWLEPVIEMSPSKAKKKTTWHWRASKDSMNYNIAKIFWLSYKSLDEDEADALSILYTYLTELWNKKK